MDWTEVGNRLKTILSLVEQDDADWTVAMSHFEQIDAGTRNARVMLSPDAPNDFPRFRALLDGLSLALKRQHKLTSIHFIVEALRS